MLNSSSTYNKVCFDICSWHHHVEYQCTLSFVGNLNINCFLTNPSYQIVSSQQINIYFLIFIKTFWWQCYSVQQTKIATYSKLNAPLLLSNTIIEYSKTTVRLYTNLVCLFWANNIAQQQWHINNKYVLSCCTTMLSTDMFFSINYVEVNHLSTIFHILSSLHYLHIHVFDCFKITSHKLR